MRSSADSLPEIELLALEDDEPAAAIATVDVKAKRWWPVALGAALVAGAVLVTGHGSGHEVAAPPTTAVPPSTLFRPATADVPSAFTAADAARRSSPAVLISSDATSLIVLSEGGAFEVDVAEPPDTIAGYVARPPGTVVTLSNGLVRAYSRKYPDGIELGSARAVFASSDPKRVWLSGVHDGGSAVKEMPVDGTVPPQLATGFIRLPDGFDVVGVAGAQLVLSTDEASLNPFELRTWDPATRSTRSVTHRGSLLAASDAALAWTRPGCEDCGIYLRRGDTISIIQSVPNLDPSVPGAFSPDGRFLAVAITGAWPGGGTGAIVHSVAVVDLDRGHYFEVATPDIRSTTPVAMTWSGGGALLVRDTSDRIVAYEPHAGGIARMFAFRPREAPRPPTSLTEMGTRIPHTMPLTGTPPTTLAPVIP
jgi:hypothetical protein